MQYTVKKMPRNSGFHSLFVAFTVFFYRPKEAVGIRRNLGVMRKVSQSISKVVLCTHFFRIQIHLDTDILLNLDADSDQGFSWHRKFSIKTVVYVLLNHFKDHPLSRLQEKPQAQKRNLDVWNSKFFPFSCWQFWPAWIRIRIGNIRIRWPV